MKSLVKIGVAYLLLNLVGCGGENDRTDAIAYYNHWYGMKSVTSAKRFRTTTKQSGLIPLMQRLAMFSAYYNYCWQTRKPGKSGKKRPSAAMMAKLTGHVWSFDELFDAVFDSGGR